MHLSRNSFTWHPLAALAVSLTLSVPFVTANSRAQTLRIEGECIRELLDESLLVRKPGEPIPSDARRGEMRFKLDIDGASWVLRARYSIDGFKTEGTYFSDGTDFYSLFGVGSKLAASIAKHPVPSGGLGDLQTIWFVLCRPFSPDFAIPALPTIPNLAAIQNRSFQHYSQITCTTNSSGLIEHAEMAVEVGGQYFPIDEFAMEYGGFPALTVPHHAVRTHYALDRRDGTPLPLHRFTVLVSSVEHLEGSVALPELGSPTTIADYRLIPVGGEGWFVSYVSTKWRSESELLNDPDILARLSLVAAQMAKHGSDRRGRERRVLLGRTMFGVLLFTVLAGFIAYLLWWRSWPSQTTNKPRSNQC